jgi:hypothetical protein
MMVFDVLLSDANYSNSSEVIAGTELIVPDVELTPTPIVRCWIMLCGMRARCITAHHEMQRRWMLYDMLSQDMTAKTLPDVQDARSGKNTISMTWRALS